MATRNILKRGDPALQKVSRPVTNFDERLHILLDDMRATLEESGGVGLAAPQVGILRRVVVIVDGEEQMVELVNPEIIRTDGEQDGFEGCLSVPGYFGMVKRPMEVTVRAQDRFGKTFEMQGSALTARCCCHEVEHLDGHLFTERVNGRLYTEAELNEMYEAQQREREAREREKKE